MSENTCSEIVTMGIGRLTLQDSPDVPAGVADGDIAGYPTKLIEAAQCSTRRFTATLVEMFKNPDSWGWNRLLPYDVFNYDDLPLYKSYLEKFYEANKHSAADAVMTCLQKENRLRSMCPSSKLHVTPYDDILSDDILECMSRLQGNEGGQSVSPIIAVAAECIGEEAELLMNWMIQEAYIPTEERLLNQDIRRCALELATIDGCDWSSDVAAVLLGIKKEAQLFCANMGRAGFDSYTSTMIHGYGFEFLSYKLDEYALGSDMSEGSDEMAMVDGNVDAAANMQDMQ